MQNRSFPPVPWVKVGLAILPGLFALATGSGLFRSALSEGIAQIVALSGLIAVCILLIIAGLTRERRLSVWILPALGIVIALFSAWWWVPVANVLSTLVDLPSPLWHLAPPVLEFAGLSAIAVPAAYRVYRGHGIHIPRSGWVLLGLMIFLYLAQLITLIRVGPSPYEWITPRIWDALWGLGVILSSVAIGLPLAWREGTLGGVMVVAFQYIMVDDLVDCVMVGGHPAYGICLCTSRQVAVIVLSCLPALLFLVVSPMWVLRSRSARGQVWGLILPPFIAVVSGEVIRAILCLATPSEYWIDWWFTHLLSSSQYLIAVALAAVIYHWIGRQGPMDGTQGHREG